MNQPDLTLRTLGDAMSFAMMLIDRFPDDHWAAAWLGDAQGEPTDFLISIEDEPGSMTNLLAEVEKIPAAQLVLWRSVDAEQIADSVAITKAFLDRRDGFERSDVHLVDEILCVGDYMRSLAVTSFSDRWGWDDVSERIDGRRSFAGGPDAA